MPNFGRLILPLIVITDQFAIISYLEQKSFFLFSPPPSLLVFHSIIKIKISRASTRIGWFRPRRPRFENTLQKFSLRWEKSVVRAKKKRFSIICREFIEFFFFLYFVVSMTIARSDRKRLRIFFPFYIFHLFMSHLHRQNAISTECL